MLAQSFVFTVYSYVFITDESNSERVVGSNYFICLQTNSMWGNCDSANTSRLDSYYLSTDHCNVEKNVLWLCLSLISTYSVNSSAGSLLPNFGPM